MRARRTATLVATLLLAACRGPDRGAAYVTAYAAGGDAESAGHFAEAARHYDDAARGAKIKRDGEHSRYLAARALERSGDLEGATVRLRAIAEAAPPQEDSAEAAYELAEMQLARGDDAGWSSVLGVARRFPSDGIARRALRRWIEHQDDTGSPRATLDKLGELTTTFDRTDLGETVAYETALHLATLGEDARARDAFAALAARWPYPKGAFWDDSLFRASVLDEKLGRFEDAARDLQRMLDQRESSAFMGSYERPRYEPAIVRLCALYRDRMNDGKRARECFDRIYADFPHSELRDDALWEEARLFREAGDQASSCDRLSKLAKEFSDSRYVPCAIAACPSIVPSRYAGAPSTCHPYLQRFRLGVDAAP